MNCQKLKGVTELRKGCSSESSLKAASRHFDLFLEEVISSGTIGGKEKQQLFPIRSINNSTDSNNIDNSERLDGDAQTQYSFKTIAVEKINDKLLNLFAGYLTRAEKLRGNKNETQDNFSDGNGISYNTAERYLSSIKNEILRRCLDLGLKRSFDDAQQTRIRQSMTRRFVERAVRNKTPLARSHVTAARNDFLVIALLCIWDGSFPMADMLFYLLTLRYLAGRGQEVAMISRSRVSLGEPSEWADSGDKTFVVRLWRSKVSHEQDLSIVPHQSEMLLDWVFAFAYSAVMNTNPNDSLFPTFAEKVELRNLSAGNINDEEIGNETTQDSTLKAKVDSSKKVTKYFQALLERLIKTSEELVGPNEMARAAGLYQDDEDFSEEFDGSSCVGTTSVNNEPGIFNLTGEEETVGLDPPANAAYYYSGLLHKHGISAGLSTHSAKRSAVEMANESALLLTTWVCFRAGWLMKAVHTIFDYLSFNPKNDRQVSRVFSEWNTPSFRGEILGGRPPRLHPIRLQGFKEAEKVRCFVAALFVNYEDKGIDSNIFCTIDDRKNRLRELRNLYDLLTATILRYLPKFVKVLQEHPNPSHPFRQGQRTCIEKHPFLLRILKASQTAGILWDELKAWSTLVQKDFLERNFESASWSEMLEVVGEEQFSADPRTLGGYMETTNRTMNTIQLGQSRMLETTSIHDARLKELTTTVSIQGQAIEECRQALAEIKTLLKEALGKPDILIPAINQGQEQLPINPSAAERMLEIDQQVLPVYSLPEKLKDMDLTDLFQQWHFQQWHLQMYSGGTKQRGISSQIRFGMEYFSLFLPAQVPPLPTGTVNPMELLAEPWRRQIRFLANKAFEAMADFFETKGLKVPKSLTPFKKAMFLIDASEWPKGPQDPSPFPILSKKGKKEELRNYDCLQKSQEKEKLKVQNRLQKRGSATKQTLPVVVDTT